jgi:hypothetical protein
MKKRIAIWISLLLAVSVFFAGGCEPAGEKLYTKSGLIESVKGVGYLSGRRLLNYDPAWCVLATDVGHPMYDGTTDTVFFFHGDTFNSENIAANTMWRSNVGAYINGISEYDFGQGIKLSGYLSSNPDGIATAIIEGYHIDGLELTKIPRGAVEIGGVYYMFYMSMCTMTGAWINNYTGVVKSVDHGQTWTRVYDLTWIRPDRAGNEFVRGIITETVDLEPSGETIDFERHIAGNFLQVSPVDGKDGYVYLYAIPEGIHCNLSMARVAHADFENFEKYEYYTGTDADGQPVWIAGYDGLQAINDNPDSYVIKIDPAEPVYSSVGEPGTIFYNQYLKKWIMSYHLKAATMQFRTADNVYGPYSDAMTIMDLEDFPFPDGAEQIYGCFSLEILARDGGKKIYMGVSLWNPYETYMVEVTFK